MDSKKKSSLLHLSFLEEVEEELVEELVVET
jgi:hypothetical protein